MTAHTPLISVIVPVYNQEAYVAACIGSLRAQTMDDAEMIVVDDGSTDDSVRVMRNAIAGDARFTIVEQTNQGVAVARNTGLDMARGTWVCFIDPDDEFARGRIEFFFLIKH